MSVEENKKLHQKINEEVWMGKDLGAVDRYLGESVVSGDGKAYSRAEIKKYLEQQWADQKAPKLVKVEHHMKIGEGDYLAVWQTNHFADGTTVEGVSVNRCKDGKIVENRWFTKPAPQQS